MQQHSIKLHQKQEIGTQKTHLNIVMAVFILIHVLKMFRADVHGNHRVATKKLSLKMEGETRAQENRSLPCRWVRSSLIDAGINYSSIPVLFQKSIYLYLKYFQ